jgi:hypothetical protein
VLHRLIHGATLVALVLLPVSAGAAGVRLEGWAGAGGAVKASRWTPLIVAVDSPQPFTGSVRVTWGDLRLTRELAVPAAGRRLFEILLRTANPESSVRLELTGNGIQPVSLDLPVKVLDQNEPVTLCVTSEGAAAEPPCSVSTSVERLPRSVRGYESIDDLRWSGGGTRPAADQQKAIDAWQSLRQLESSGDLGLSPRATRPAARRGVPAPASRVIAAVAIAYAIALLTIGTRMGLSRRRLATVLATVTAIVIAGGVVGMAIGRVGPGAAVRIEHASLLEQIPGTDLSLLTMEALATYPAFNETSIAFPLADAAIESSTASGRAVQLVDEHGAPLLRGVHALAERRAFSLEAIVDMQPLGATVAGQRWTVSNRSSSTLSNCRFGSGFPAADARDLPPGTRVTAEQTGEIAGPVVTCTMEASPVAATGETHRVNVTGPTVVALYRNATPGSASPGERR